VCHHTARASREPWGVGTILLGLILPPAHFVYATLVSVELFRLAGGIRQSGKWTEYGGIDWAWTNLAWIPGGFLLTSIPVIALVLLVIGSVAAGFCTAATMVEVWSGKGRRSTFWHWWLLASASCWLVWVPVPVKMTLTYWHTVDY
jgi:hypothetical protein